MLCELNGKRSDAPGARLDENLLPLLKIRFFDQRLPSRQANQRDGSSFFHGESFWFYRQGSFFDRNKFSESTHSKVIRPGIDLITRFEVAHRWPDPDHDAGHIVTQSER
jgi:hypothetical protein